MVPIFYYHSVGGPEPWSISTANFRAHVELLCRYGFQTVTVGELVRGPLLPGRRYAALAFDDGLLDNYTEAFPIMQEYGCRGTFFIVPGYEGATHYLHPHTGRWNFHVPRLDYTVAFPVMKRAQRLELVAAGMEIGSHSFTHPRLAYTHPAQLDYETRASKNWLEDDIGQEVRTFCYPYGSFSPKVIVSVRQAGYTAACTTLPGYFDRSPSPYWLRRWLIEDPIYFESVLQGRAFHPAVLIGLLRRFYARRRAFARMECAIPPVPHEAKLK